MPNQSKSPLDSAPQADLKRWATRAGVAIVVILLVLAVGALNSSATNARIETRAEGGESFVKVNKLYINLNTISHVVDEPGFNQPPGSMQVYFAGAPQNFIFLYGDQAEAFRQLLHTASVDHSPKDSGSVKAADKPAKKLSIPPKKAVPSTDPG